MSVDVDSFDGANEVENHEHRVARKEHKCSACRETIRPGDLYSYNFFVLEGSNSTVKRCLRCETIYSEISKRLDGDSVPDERLQCGHSWEENFNEPPPDEIARLAFMTKDEIQAEFRKAAAE